MATINIPNEYPVELTPPDISAYAKGNTGVPHIWAFDSGVPGPNVMISAIVHGNEPCGAIAIDWLMQRDVRPAAGKLTLGFMNIAAYEAFDPADPNATRWIDEDFNRVWGADVLDGDRESVELRRAREVRPVLDDVDFLFDLHTMQHLAPPLMMSGRHPKAKALAARVGVPERVVGDAGHAAGRRMRDYGGFDDPASPKTALLIECGQHWEQASEDLAIEATVRFLAALGTIDAALAEPFGPAPGDQSFFTVKQAVTIESEKFTFAEPFTGGELLARAGTLIGHDGEAPVTTPEDNMMLVMPSKRLWKGQTAVRLATMDPS
ncbi:MAG: M14 family metallopeptidase [Pseudomonadota bacterium]